MISQLTGEEGQACQAWPQMNEQHAFAVAAQRIGRMDLSMVKLKLMDSEEGLGWGQSHADEVEIRYRRFLCMIYVCRDGSVVPTKDIDAFWHQHILDTRAYAADCEQVFGEFIHHFPYFGMRGEADAEDLVSSFATTEALYARAFGEPYAPSVLDATGAASCATKCGSGKCTKCGSRCGSSKCHHPRAA